MPLLDLIYFIFFGLALISAVLVVTLRNTVYCALSLVVTMLCLTAIFLIIQSPFVAIIQLFVYAGAIMVLFVYVVMLVNPKPEEGAQDMAFMRPGFALLFGAMFIFMMLGWMVYALLNMEPNFTFQAFTVAEVATHMMRVYLLPFELTSILLLVTIIGAILIAKRS